MTPVAVALLVACAEPPPPPPAPAPAPEARTDGAAALPAAEQRASTGRRIVAIGDLHGDRDATLEVLALAGVADAQGRWIGGDTVFVQTGDVTDRGPDSKGVIDLMRSLAEQAPAHGGEAHLLNGNHEVMNLQGDWRYVSPEDIAGFGGRSKRAIAFGRNGDYGKWLATLPMVAKVDDTIFVHGGVTPEIADLGVDGINTTAREHYFDPPGPDGHPINGDRGPTWYRGYVQDAEAEACAELEKALATLGAKRMVVGHTTRRDGVVEARCGGRITVIDIGISAHYGRHLGAWESLDGDARALMPSGPVDLPDP
ncbi:MAG: metallophosphoesterase [Alphaproteobacteria bacterium]|nr:metallophosphoesterase [Alphaproteobacteria bacterium]